MNGRVGQVWGTWSFRTQVNVTPPVILPSLVTFHVDGAIVGIDGTMLGGTPGAATRTSPTHGVWVRTGFRQVAGTSLYMIFDAAGVRVAFGRARSSLTFAADFDSFTGKIVVETAACPTPISCPDPADKALVWTPFSPMPADGFPVTGKRVEPVVN